MIIPLLLLLLAASPGLERATGGPAGPPGVTAEAWVVYDEASDTVVAGHRFDEARPMASTTKMMTALLAAENSDPEELVLVSGRAEATDHKQVFLEEGEQWLVQDLLEATLVVSANDAAVALAEHVAGSVDAFVEMMNLRAAMMGLSQTTFRNPHGLDAAGHGASPRDLVKLAQAVMAHDDLAGIVARTRVMLPEDDGWQAWDSTNELLDPAAGIFGVKTGRTRGAGHVLVTGADRLGRRVYVAVMGSRDAFADATALLDYAFAVLAAGDLRLVPTMEFESFTRALPAAVSRRPIQAHLIHTRLAWQ